MSCALSKLSIPLDGILSSREGPQREFMIAGVVYPNKQRSAQNHGVPPQVSPPDRLPAVAGRGGYSLAGWLIQLLDENTMEL